MCDKTESRPLSIPVKSQRTETVTSRSRASRQEWGSREVPNVKDVPSHAPRLDRPETTSVVAVTVWNIERLFMEQSIVTVAQGLPTRCPRNLDISFVETSQVKYQVT